MESSRAAVTTGQALSLASHITEVSSEEFTAYFRWLRLRAKGLVNEPINRRMIDALASTLLKRKTLSERDARSTALSLFPSQ